MKLVFAPTATQKGAIELLLQQQQDPSSANYHKWLTPEQYASRFGLSQNDLNKIAAWLRSQGFHIVESSRSRTYIAFSGSATQVQASFRTPIHRYMREGAVHYANAVEPSIPTALVGIVSGVTALNNFQPLPRMVKARPRVTSSVTGNHFMAPGDFATIYNLTGLYSSGVDGTGQTIAVMGQTDLVTDSNGNYSDIVTFRTASGLSAPNLKVTLIPGATDPGIQSGDIDEANLDVEWSGGVAKNATILYIIGNPTTGNGVFDSLQYAISNDIAPVISISYGLCEGQLDATTQNTLAMAAAQANIQGQTIVAPSGDSGAADCDSGAVATHGLAVDFPGSMPYVTSMGGSEFTGNPAGSDVAGTVTTNTDGTTTAAATTYWTGSSSVSDTKATAISYIPETVWNDTTTDAVLSASGGGVSTLFNKPTWQTGTGVPNDNQRDVPDISLSTSADHDGYLICSQGSCVCGFRNSCTVTGNQGTFSPSGGTSAAVPTFAAIVALINQKTAGTQGNVNPNLYALATSTPSIFHDITTGNNIVPCTIGTTGCPATTSGQIGYSAGTGYDLASGLGSIDAGALVAAWSSPSSADFWLTTKATSAALSSGATGTATIIVSANNGFASTVTLGCSVSTSLGATTCSFSPASVNGSGIATLTIHGATLTSTLNRRQRLPPGGWGMGSSFFFAAVLLFPTTKRRQGGTPRVCSTIKRHGIGALLTVAILGLVLGISSCGGGSSSSNNGQGQTIPTPLSGTVTVTAVSGSLSHSTQIAVTIN